MDPLDIIKQLSVPGSAPTVLQPIICPETGRILGYEEQWNLSSEVIADASHSMSLNRAPDPKALGLALGRRGNMPFLPGGLESDVDEALKQSESICGAEEQRFLDFSDILKTPPGFDSPVEIADILEVSNISPTHSLPPGIVSKSNTNSSVVDKLLEQNLDTNFDIAKKLHSSFRPVLISTQDEEPKKEDSTNEVEEKAKTILNEMDDLTIKRDNQSEFTYAKFLDEAKVAKRFDEHIRPIMAKTYPFELDMFQKQAIVSMEANESVFVAAHTSAGKTVVAEYAIALSKIHKTRVIYTSPIKALSNQKFREFKLIFDDVGLITGDIQLNTDAFCLIMTTEVLRSMLYNGSEVIRELEWVIFDEIHYINDEERGYVWEESLIMLPSHVSIVMLSATVPNCIEFADWIGRIKQRQINVIQTLKRPVPLEHFIYTGHNGKSREDLFLLMNKTGQLLNYGHRQAVASKENSAPPDPRFQKPQSQGGKNIQRGGKGVKIQQQQMLAAAKALANGEKKKSNFAMDRSIYSNLVLYLKAKNFLPVVVFVFSRKRCDDNANMMQSSDLTTQTEKHEVLKFFDKCVHRLNGSDKILPQVVRMRELCERGFAVHHSGILPILKEVVELLFQRGLIKVLFATETFAMGVNMPARCVVFDAIEKFDGMNKRPLNATEYTQMAGRAGRRGLDETGIVIILVKHTVPPIISFTQLLTGKAVSLDSRFRVTYSMILKLLCVEQFRIEDMLQRSYVERSSLRLVVSRKQQITELNAKIDAFPDADCSNCLIPGPDYTRASIDELFYDLQSYFNLASKIWETSMVVLLQKHLVKGRLILVNYPPLGLTGRLAVVLNTKKNEHGKHTLCIMLTAEECNREAENLQIKTFNALSEDIRRNQTERMQIMHAATQGLLKVNDYERQRSYRIIHDFDPVNMLAICKANLKNVDADTIINEDSKRGPSVRPRSPDRAITRVVAELNTFAEKWCFSKPEVANFGSDIKLKEINSYQLIQEFTRLSEKLLKDDEYPCKKCPHFDNHFARFLDRNDLCEKLQQLTYQTSTNALVLSEEYTNRIRVLKSIDYIDKNGIIGLKGKVACVISHMEVLITELLFENKFDGKSCAELAAMLSPMTCQFTYAGSKDRDRNMEYKHAINYLLREEVVEIASRIDLKQQTGNVHNSLLMDELRFGLMDVVYEWASGTAFSDIMLVTDCQEGLIVRCIQRLDEVLKDICSAARMIGNPLLYQKMEETSSLIKRDIVFAASLYTTDE